MSVAFKIQTVCECQALLGAELNESQQVLHGWARKSVTAAAEPAPANSVDADGDRFDVVWQCPMCGRNSLRSFYRGALERVAMAEPAAESAAEPAAGAS